MPGLTRKDEKKLDKVNCPVNTTCCDTEPHNQGPIMSPQITKKVKGRAPRQFYRTSGRANCPFAQCYKLCWSLGLFLISKLVTESGHMLLKFLLFWSNRKEQARIWIRNWTWSAHSLGTGFRHLGTSMIQRFAKAPRLVDTQNNKETEF